MLTRRSFFEEKNKHSKKEVEKKTRNNSIFHSTYALHVLNSPDLMMEIDFASQKKAPFWRHLEYLAKYY